MSGRDLQSLLKTTPFVPLRLYAADGRTYDLRHPEQAIVMSTYVVIPVSEDGNLVPSDSDERRRLEFLSLMHIIRAEQLVAPSTNGAAHKSPE